jgi:hypothetical protein
MAITLTFDQPDAGIPAGSVDRGRTDIKSTGAIGSPRAHPVTITVGNIPTAALVDVVLLDEPPGANPLLTELAPETWRLEFDVGCWGPFRVRVTATASDAVVSSVTRRISIRSPGYHIDYPGLAERYDPNATAVPTVPSVEITEMNEGSTNRPLVDFHRQLVVAIEGGVGGGGVIPDGSITEEKLAPELSDNLLRADGTIPFTADQNAAGNTVANLGTPTAAGDAVPLSYLNASFVLSGIRTPVRLVATVPITASNTQVVDSKPTVNGDRVLLTSQASPVDNGIFVANDAGAWLRATDADASVDMLPGVVVFVTDGTEHAESGWILATDAPIALGTSPLTYARFTGAAQLVAGDGLTKTGNSVDVVAHADGSIAVSADAVQVGTLATDAQHGARGGGTQHAAAVAGGASGFLTGADKTKLDGVASGAAALTSSAPANVGTTAAVGVATTAARADHVHAHAAQTDGTLHAAATPSVAGFQSAADKTKLDGISSGAAALSSTTPAAVAFTGTVGVGTTAARADHVHAHAAQTDGTLHAAATPSVAGFQSAADKTKLDTIATSAAALTATAPTQITVTTAAAGVATVAAKGDHVHSVSTGAPSALAVGGAQSTGSATSLARSDHQHAMPAVATTGADGFMSAADKTRLDGMATAAAALTSTAPVNVDNAAAAVGVGTTAARHDHRHTVSIGTPVALTVGGTNAQGSATSLVRSDHTHAMPGVVTPSVDGFASAADKTKLDGIETGAQVTSFARVQTALAAASSPVSFNSQKITNVLNPTADQEVATKSYVDAVASGLDLKTSCRLVATTNVTASGVQVIDGVTTATGDRLLLTSQTAPATNGIYVASGVTWLRAADADVSAEVTSGLYTYITEGTANADSGWALTTNDPIVLGTTALVFTQISGAGQINAGGGMTKTGNTLDVVAHGDGSIVVNADNVQLGVIATDAQHGARAGGTTHAAVIAGGASGFMTGTDKTKLDGVATSAAALTSSAPANVGTTAAVGVGTTAARSDHVHAHAAQTDGTLHAAATTSVAGFLSSADKARLDGLVASYKTAVRVASVAHISNVDIPGNQPSTVDGIALALNDRVLVKDQVTVTNANGLYYVTVVGTGANGTWLKAQDADNVGELVAGSLVYVAEGTQAGQWWQLSTLGTITPGTTAQAWVRQTHSLASSAPANVGTAAAVGVGTTGARSDHVHAHGAQTDGTLHAAVVAAGASGFMSGTDKTKLDGIATGAAAVLSVTPLQVDGSSGNGGAAVTASRSDHRHQVTTGTPVALTLAASTADGTSNNLARADHVHALPASSTAPTALTVGGSSAAGSSTSISKADHVHGMPGAATTGAAGFMSAADKTKLDGVSTSAAALTSTAPLENTGVAAVGVATAAARGDHQHPTAWKAPVVASEVSETFNPASPPTTVDGVTIAIGDRILVSDDPLSGIYVKQGDGTWLLVETLGTGEVVEVLSEQTLYTANASGSYVPIYPYANYSEGGLMSALHYAKIVGIQDSAAAVGSSVASQISVTAATAGAASTAARSDHVHNVSTGSPVSLPIGSANTIGVATSLSRSDHVHTTPALATTSISGYMSAADKARVDVGALPYSASVAVNTWTTANSSGTRTLPSPAVVGDTVAILVTSTGVNIAAGSGNSIIDASSSGVSTISSVPFPALYTFRCAVGGFWFMGDNLASPSSPALPGLMSAADKSKLNGIASLADVTMTALANASAAVSVNGQRITNVAAPTATTDAINRLWLDNILLGMDKPNGCRLSGHAGNAVMPADNAACTTLYFHPFVSDSIWLLVNGIQWLPCRIPSGGLSLALSGLTVGRPYDVFIVAPTTWSPSPATYTIELLAWTNTTTRATGVLNQGGFYTLATDPTRRYVGTIYARAANSFAFNSGTVSTTAKCDLWNADNRVPASLYGGANWSAGGVTVAAANTWQGINANCKCEIMIGQNLGEPIDVLFDLSVVLGGSTAWIGTGLNIMTAASIDNPQLTAASTTDWHFFRADSRYVQTAAGANYVSWLIKAASTSLVKFFYQDSAYSGQMRADFYY